MRLSSDRYIKTLVFRLVYLIFWFALFFEMGCAPRKASISHPIDDSKPSDKVMADDKYVKIEKRIRTEYKNWKGTKHRLGGNDYQGVDCSGFVRAVYKKIFNIDLPRTAKAQIQNGRPVSRKKLKAGDLVFFKPPSYPLHVGIFLGGDEFVHASKRKGVTISHIDPVYWSKYYWTARRILK